jgi:protein-L-isoaspartate O-methyltransferase
MVPDELLMQMKSDGRLVMPFGEGREQEMMVIRESSTGEFESEVHGKFSFVPMLEKRNSQK